MVRKDLPQIQVCSNKNNCWKLGGREVYTALKVHHGNGRFFELIGIDCNADCGNSPTVVVYFPGRDRGINSNPFMRFGYEDRSIDGTSPGEIFSYDPKNVDTLLRKAFPDKVKKFDV